ncbi:hypothetical protein WG922_12230 [Ramlibacter sp. AN1015]|uniref:hypothetical protein n=1 Tax=Ramlibacter sp. AN1015 TaxID=3133428 RepID=UPI0030BB82EB
MALFRKVVMLAITSGLAKKAWDSYRRKSPVEAGRAKASLKEAGRKLTGRDRDSNRPGSY